jgi:DNA-binding CsgD family transcriptional regulator
VAATAPLLPANAGVYGFTYDASNPESFHLETVVPPKHPPGTGSREIESLFAQMTGPDVRQSFGKVICGTASEVFGDSYQEKIRFPHFEPYGIVDTLGVNALDPTGRGTGIGALLEKRSQLGRVEARGWTLVAAHVAAARRLRRTLAGRFGSDPTKRPQVEAVVTPRGSLEYAANQEVVSARRQLVDAIDMLRAAKKRGRSRSLVEGLEMWRAMVGARWSLVEHFEVDGKRYMVAVRNEATPRPGAFPGIEKLTLRECQVVGFTLMGHTSKVTAYELGISPNTVRVLLARGMKKLGIHSARELAQLATGR